MQNHTFKKILVANRGEIAVRVMNACREMNISSVAVYSEADRSARHVLEAGQAVEIGPAPPLESYLNIARIVDAAIQTGCDAIHPGYGFLSENAEFARACRKAGLIFIGPTPEAMEMVGDKLTARRTMIEAGVPVTPGMEIDGSDWQEIEKAAQSVGFPIMVKATAGGGGKGMRVVREMADLSSAIAASQREAKSAFGNDLVYIEKFIERPRHIEYQVLGDTHGNLVHLFERECSIQRRHQKIVEETPSPALDDALRREMGETACRVMNAVDYHNAGTVEFLLDEDNNYYFLEVNARIQVEHPITEMVTGIDLVKQQIRVAAGEKLPFKQSDLQQRGHAIECRIYAEDASNQFFPSIGTLLFVKEPEGPGIRCDSGIYSGLEVTHHYDPILSKLVVVGENREDSLAKMKAALSNYVILGVQTSLRFLYELMDHPEFVSGNLHTGFLSEHMQNWQPSGQNAHLQPALIAAALASTRKAKPAPGADGEAAITTPWQSLGSWDMFN